LVVRIARCAAGTGSFLEEQAEKLGIIVAVRLREPKPKQEVTIRQQIDPVYPPL
jgi:activator of 2-hydroxyglutaryl-CoA dehydratase